MNVIEKQFNRGKMSSFDVLKLSNGNILGRIQLVMFCEEIKKHENLNTDFVEAFEGEDKLYLFNPTMTFKESIGAQLGDLHRYILRYYSYDFSYYSDESKNKKQIVSKDDIALFESQIN